MPTVNCIVYESAVKALHFLRDSDVIPNYIFLDVFMNEMNGKECLAQIKGIETLNEVPVIMYSGLDDDSQAAVYKSLVAADFISKPSSMNALRNILAAVSK